MLKLSKPPGQRRFQIEEGTDPPGALMLFSVLLPAAREAELQTGKGFEVRAGTLLIWRNTSPPSLEDLRTCALTGNLPELYRRMARASPLELRDGVFGSTLRLALQHAPTFGISSPGQICRVVAAVAQTQLTQEPSIRAHNFQLARKYREPALRRIRETTSATAAAANAGVISTPAPTATRPTQMDGSLPAARQRLISQIALPRQPYKDRVDERGGYVQASGVKAWYATYRGPEFAKKAENQDAACVLSCDTGVIFAIADGVSTSTGARFGAAATVFLFCHKLRDELAAEANPGRDLLLRATEITHASMDRMLDSLVANWTSHDFREVYGEMPRESAARLLENTGVPKRKNWQPALASTLIGGFVLGTGSGASGWVLRIGDGIVERVTTNRRVATVFGMDSSRTEISSFFGPGPVCAEALPMAVVEDISVGAGEMLLVSSDGLARGHTGAVYEKLCSMLGADCMPELSANENVALAVLQRAAAKADEYHAAGANSNLFADNLSLIVISPVGVAAQ